MKFTSKLYFILIASLLLSVSINAQQKIGFLVADQLITELPAFKSANSQLEALAGQFKTQLTEKENKIRTKVKEAEAKAASLSPAQIKAIQDDLAKDQQSLYADEQRYKQDLVKKEQELLDPIYTKVRTAIEAVAKSNGYSYILEGSSLMFAGDSDDVSALVKRQLGL